jgi:hypothetical protein
MMRVLIGIVVGLAVAIGLQTGLEFLSSQIFPYRPFDVLDRVSGAAVLGTRPVAANLLGMFGYRAGALGGGYAGRWIARRDWVAWLPCGLLAAAAAVFALYYSLTGWGQAGAFVAALLGGLVAHRLPMPALAEGADTPAES